MTATPDMRIPVRFAPPATAGMDSAWLIEGDAPAPCTGPVARFCLPAARIGHPAGCACCAPRGPVAEALSKIFLARARGEIPFFREVLAVPLDAAGAIAIRAALAQDALISGRFRLLPD